MYTNEFCGLRIQIPEGERIPESDFQEAKQRLEDILNYASYCAENVHNKEQKNINLPIKNTKQHRYFLSVLVDQNNVYAANFQLDKCSKQGVLTDKINIEDILAIDVLKAENRIYNYIQMEEKSYNQGYGLESAWSERIKQINKEREHTKDTHYDEYARMEHSSAKRNAERKFPVQQNRISTSRRPPSPVPVPPSDTRPSARTPVQQESFLSQRNARVYPKKENANEKLSQEQERLQNIIYGLKNAVENGNENRPAEDVVAQRKEVVKRLEQQLVEKAEHLQKTAKKQDKTPDPDTVRREQFLQMIKSSDPAAMKKYMDTVTKYAKQQNLAREQNFPQRKVSGTKER